MVYDPADPERYLEPNVLAALLRELQDTEDPVLQEIASLSLERARSSMEAPTVPAPGSGLSRFGGMLMRGASLGATGYPRPPEGIGESITEFVGSIPTIAAIGAATGPLVAPVVSAARVPAVAAPLVARTLGAGVTGATVGGIKAGIAGEDVLPAAATEGGLFAATEALLGTRGLVRDMRAARAAKAGAPPPAPPAGPAGQPVMPMGPRGGGGGGTRGPGGRFTKKEPEDITVEGAAEGAAAPPKGIRGMPVGPRLGSTAEDYLVPGPPDPALGAPSGHQPIHRATSAAAQEAIEVAARQAPRRPSRSQEAAEDIAREPKIDLVASRDEKGALAFSVATEERADQLANAPTMAANYFLRDPARRTISGGIDVDDVVSPSAFLGKFRRFRDKAFSPLYISAAGETMKKLGNFWSFRTMRGAFGDTFSTQVLNRAAMMNIRAENEKSKWAQEFFNALSPVKRGGMIGKSRMQIWGPDKKDDEAIYAIMTNMSNEGRYVGEAGIYTPAQVQAAENLHEVYRRLAQQYPKASIDVQKYLRGYAPLVRQRQGEFGGIVREPKPTLQEAEFIKSLTPQEAQVLMDIERIGMVIDKEPSASAAFNTFINAVTNGQIRRPFFEHVEDYVSGHFGVRWSRLSDGRSVAIAADPVGYQAWRDLEAHMMGSMTPTDTVMNYTWEKFINLYRETAGKAPLSASDRRSIYKFTGGLQSLYYSGAMGMPGIGGRPASVIRQLAQIVPTFAELGTKYTMAGLQKIGDKEYIRGLRQGGLLQSPFEQAVERVGLARGAGRAISAMSEFSLKLFSWTDEMMRVVTAAGSEAKFADYLGRNALAKLPARPEIKERISKLVAEGQVREAQLEYMMDNVANLQYVYGKANRPQVFRGALGNLVGMFTSYPLNTFEMYRMFGKRAWQGMKTGHPEEVAPLVRMLGLTTGILMAGSELANADLRSAFFIGAVPYSLTFVAIGGNAYTAGRTTAEALMGNLFLVGETDYHRKTRYDAYRTLARDSRAFVPGGVFMFNDLPALADERLIQGIFALTPKADVLNQLARERAQQARRQQGGMQSYGGYGAIKP